MNFLLVYDEKSAQAYSAALSIDTSLKCSGHATTFVPRDLIVPSSYEYDFEKAKQAFNQHFQDINFAEVDMMLVFGGDGSILKAVQLSTAFDIPVMGFNYGRLGYLSNRFDGDVYDFFEEFLADYQQNPSDFV